MLIIILYRNTHYIFMRLGAYVFEILVAYLLEMNVV